MPNNNLRICNQLIKKHNIEVLDLKALDLTGRLHHISLPIQNNLLEKLIKEGVGFDGSSYGFRKVENSDMILIPDLATAVVDPFIETPTLSFYSHIVLTDSKHSPFLQDVRFLAQQTEPLLKQITGADTSWWGPEFEFYIFSKQAMVVEQLLISSLCGEHSQIEGPAGVGKWLAVDALAQCLGLEARKLRSSRDLTPEELLGLASVEAARDQPPLEPRGPLFANLVFVDNLDHLSRRMYNVIQQSMQEQAVDVAGRRWRLPSPFSLFAARHIPDEQAEPCLDLNVDRFLFKILVAYPPYDEEYTMAQVMSGTAREKIRPVLTADEFAALQARVGAPEGRYPSPSFLPLKAERTGSCSDSCRMRGGPTTTVCHGAALSSGAIRYGEPYSPVFRKPVRTGGRFGS